MAVADRINQNFDAKQPWVLVKDPAKRDELQDVCSRALHGFKLLSVLLGPVLPNSRSSRTSLQLQIARTDLADCRDIADADPSLSTSHDSRRGKAARRAFRAPDEPQAALAADARRAPAARSEGSHRERYRSRSKISTSSTCASRRSSKPSTSRARTSS